MITRSSISAGWYRAPGWPREATGRHGGGAPDKDEPVVGRQRGTALTRVAALLDPRIKMLWGWAVALACILSVSHNQQGTKP
jgi:hypothetical protein